VDGGEEAPKASQGADAGDGFDMFSDDVEEVAVAQNNDEVDEAAAMDRGDNYDDKEGYFAHRTGDVLNDRYKVLGSYGKGVFSTVLRCQDLKAGPHQPQEVAIKVQRANEMMRRAGEKEIGYLQRLADGDPDNKRHCIQMLGSFDHEDHLCMVFEAMHQNLRQALRQHGHKRGIQLSAVQIYARQLFIGLRYMERLNIMHADLKPDNIVVNDKYNLLKVCDFGSAANGDDNEITPYLVSRFYRAPEIMLGLHYGCPVDMWAAGCTLYELYTGKIMFQGVSNNQMLKLIQEIKGKMPHKLIRKGFFSELHFDPDNDFVYKEKDKVSGREIVRTIKFEQRATVGKDLRTLLMPSKLPESEARKVMQLADLLEKTLMLDPSKRLTPSQALKHPFCDVTRK
jgi:serine/threonine-protein kinase PRP4